MKKKVSFGLSILLILGIIFFNSTNAEDMPFSQIHVGSFSETVLGTITTSEYLTPNTYAAFTYEGNNNGHFTHHGMWIEDLSTGIKTKTSHNQTNSSWAVTNGGAYNFQPNKQYRFSVSTYTIYGGEVDVRNVTSSVPLINVNPKPTISSISSSESYINNTNKSNFPVKVSGITEFDTDQNLSLSYSFDGASYTAIPNVVTIGEFIAGEDLTKGETVYNGIFPENQSSYNEGYQFGGLQPFYALGQTFIAPTSGKLDNIKILLSDHYTQTDSVYIRIYNGGTFLGQSSTVSGSEMTSRSGLGSLLEKTFTFSNISLTQGNTYMFEVSRTVQTQTGNNAYRVGVNDSSASPYLTSAYSNGILYRTDGSGNISLTYNSGNDDMKFSINITDIAYKTDASNGNKTSYIGAVTQDTLSGSTVTVGTSGPIDYFTGLIDSVKYYLSNTPGQISTTPGTNNVEFGTASGSTVISIKQGYYNNVEADFSLNTAAESDGSIILRAKANDGIDDSNVVTLSLTKDVVPPVITLTNPDSSPAQLKTITGSTNEGTLTMSVTTGTTCDNTLTFTSYSDMNFTSESDNGKRICYKATDTVGNTSYQLSSIVQGIDTTAPNEPNFTKLYQSAYNKYTVEGTCSYELGAQLQIKDNASIVENISFTDPCNFSYTSTGLTDGSHTIEVYAIDLAGNKTSTQTLSLVIDSVNGVIITPQAGKDVDPIFSITGFGLPGQSIQIYNYSTDDIVASGSADTNGYFAVQTSSSQTLGSLQIDLNLNGSKKLSPRTINVVATSLKTPVITNIADFEKLNTGLPNIKIQGEALSDIDVYARDLNKNIINIGKIKLSASGTGEIIPVTKLPAGENEIFVVDTIHNLSSKIKYVVLVDPWGYVYDSQTKQKISGAKITVLSETGAIVSLPNLNGQPQLNPMYSDVNGYYYSYELPGNYKLLVEKDGYTFPSSTLPSGSLNLDSTPNVGSHGQVFTVVNDVLHIDIPLDAVIPVVIQESESGRGGVPGSSRHILMSLDDHTTVAEFRNRKISVFIEKGTNTYEKTYSNDFQGGTYSDDVYRLLYESPLLSSQVNKRALDFTKPVKVSITDTDYRGENVYIRYSDDEEYVLFTDYSVTGKTIHFYTKKGFEIKIDKDGSLGGYKFAIDFYKIEQSKYVLFKKSFERKYGNLIAKLDNQGVRKRIPVFLSNLKKYIDERDSNNILYKHIYNIIGEIYLGVYTSDEMKDMPEEEIVSIDEEKEVVVDIEGENGKCNDNMGVHLVDLDNTSTAQEESLTKLIQCGILNNNYVIFKDDYLSLIDALYYVSIAKEIDYLGYEIPENIDIGIEKNKSYSQLVYKMNHLGYLGGIKDFNISRNISQKETILILDNVFGKRDLGLKLTAVAIKKKDFLNLLEIYFNF